MFLNTLISDEIHSRNIRENLLHPIQVPLSKKEKKFWILNLYSTLNILQKNELIA